MKKFTKGKVNLYLGDNVEFMAAKPDNYYDLAVVDPIYGDKGIIGGYTSGKGGGVAKQKQYNQKIWAQKKTGQEYFNELFRISKNQIIWGGNHFVKEINKNNSAWIFWDKKNGDVSFSDGEFAYTSFESKARVFSFRWSGMLQEKMGKQKEIRIVPTQKPVKLYDWIFHNYAQKDFKVFDSHGGSFSSAIAAYYYGCEFDGIELDKDYYNDAVKRFKEQTLQAKTNFIQTPKQEIKHPKLF